MSRKIINLCLTCLLCVLSFAFVSCKKKENKDNGESITETIDVQAEYNDLYDLASLKGLEGVAFYDIDVTAPAGEKVTLTDYTLHLNALGEYRVVYNGKLWKITVADTTAPSITLLGDGFTDCFVGYEISLPEVVINDNLDGFITDYDYKFTYNGTVVASNSSFVAAEAGKYSVTITVTDKNGNIGRLDTEFDVILPYPVMFKNGYEKVNVVNGETTLNIDADGLGVVISSVKDYSVSYEVYLNGIYTESREVAIGVNDYADIYVNTIDPETNEEYSLYILYLGSECKLKSFEDDELGKNPEGNFICNVDGRPSDQINNQSRTLVDVKGDNRAFSFVPKSGIVYCAWPKGDVELGKYDIILNFVLAEGTKSLTLSVPNTNITAAYSNERGAAANEKWRAVLSGVNITGDRYSFRLNDYSQQLPVTVESIFYRPALNVVYKNGIEEENEVEVDSVIGITDWSSVFEASKEIKSFEIVDYKEYNDESLVSDEIPLTDITVNSTSKYVFTVKITASDDSTAKMNIVFKSKDYDSGLRLGFADGYSVNMTCEVGDIVSLTDLSTFFTANATVTKWEITDYKEDGESKTAGESITVSSGSYYEFVVTATAENGTTDSKYLLIKAEDCYITTFDNHTLGVNPSENFVCNDTTGTANVINGTRTVEDIGYGNRAFGFSLGTNKRMTCSWVAGSGVTDGVYNVKINFKFAPGLRMAYIATDYTHKTVADNQVINPGDYTTEETYGSLTLFNANISKGRFGFPMQMTTNGKVYVDSIQFIVPDFELDYNTGFTVNTSVAANTEIVIANIFKSNYPTDYSLSVTSFKKNGAATSEVPTSITVASGEYYELIMHGEYTGNRTNITKTADKYILIKADDCYITTFDTSDPSKDFVCNALPSNTQTINNTRTVEDIGYGNRAFTITPGSSGINCNWIDSAVPAGQYNIIINFRFEAGLTRAFIATNTNCNAVKDGQDISYSAATTETTYGSLTLNGATVNDSHRYGFQMYVATTGKVYIESIQFIPVN